MTDPTLPALPEPAWWAEEHGNKHGRRGIYREQQRKHSHQDEFFGLYTADQLRAYADERVAQERERCARLCELHDAANTGHTGMALAAAIRKTTADTKGTA